MSNPLTIDPDSNLHHQAAGVKKVKDECTADLAEAIPILNEALKALDTIKKQDLDLVKAMGKPPSGVQLAMKAVLIMLEMKPVRPTAPSVSHKVLLQIVLQQSISIKICQPILHYY